MKFVEGAIQTLLRNKQWAEKAIAQTSSKNMHKPLSDDTNSIVIIMKHIAGNLRSRWTDFLTTDGEKPWRNRDDEFVDTFTSRHELMEYWESGWSCISDALQSLTPEDLDKTVTIRGEPHSVPQAIQRSLTHTCYHVGQIMVIARVLFEGDDWQVVSIPRGESRQYNKKFWGKGHYQTDP